MDIAALARQRDGVATVLVDPTALYDEGRLMTRDEPATRRSRRPNGRQARADSGLRRPALANSLPSPPTPTSSDALWSPRATATPPALATSTARWARQTSAEKAGRYRRGRSGWIGWLRWQRRVPGAGRRLAHPPAGRSETWRGRRDNNGGSGWSSGLAISVVLVIASVGSGRRLASPAVGRVRCGAHGRPCAHGRPLLRRRGVERRGQHTDSVAAPAVHAGDKRQRGESSSLTEVGNNSA